MLGTTGITPKENERLERSIAITAIRALEGEGNERKFELSFSSEEPYSRYFGSEVLDHSDGAVDLTRLNEIGVLLFNHKRDYVIGKVLDSRIDNNRGIATVEFDDDEESERICKKVKNGTLKGVSVGYRVDSWEEVMANKTSADGKYTGPAYIARKWQPYEISIVSVPADSTVGVGREMEQKEKGVSNTDVFERQLQINKNLGGM
nr:MAG TPA: major capsid protein [Caudoviricetes sp.]